VYSELDHEKQVADSNKLDFVSGNELVNSKIPRSQGIIDVYIIPAGFLIRGLRLRDLRSAGAIASHAAQLLFQGFHLRLGGFGLLEDLTLLFHAGFIEQS
jgi:hypothetical protein